MQSQHHVKKQRRNFDLSNIYNRKQWISEKTTHGRWHDKERIQKATTRQQKRQATEQYARSDKEVKKTLRSTPSSTSTSNPFIISRDNQEVEHQTTIKQRISLHLSFIDFHLPLGSVGSSSLGNPRKLGVPYKIITVIIQKL